MRNHTNLLLISLLASAIALPAAAQDYKATGYGYFGTGATNGSDFGQILNIGGGGEAMLYKGLAVGADLGYLGDRQRFQDEGFGLFSPGVGYHFMTRSSRVVPFATGGYSLAFRNGTANMFHYGGGVTYWFRPRLGLRMEVRDYRFADYPADHATVVRVGFSFR